MRTEPPPEGRERGKHPAPGSLPLTGRSARSRGLGAAGRSAAAGLGGGGSRARAPQTTAPSRTPQPEAPARSRGRDSGSEEAGSRERTGVAAQRPPGGSGEAAHSRGSMGGGLGPWETPGATAGEGLEEDGTTTGTPCSAGTRALGGQVQTTTAILDSEGGATSQGHCHCPGTSHQEPAAPASPGVLTTARGLASRSPSSLEAPTGREPAHPLSRG